MSEVARWSYANTATVRPRTGVDTWSGAATYGEEYEIACNWIAEGTQQRDQNGAEFISKNVIFTEDARPQFLDMIQLSDGSEWQEIRSRTSWDMAMFQDTNDYKLVT